MTCAWRVCGWEDEDDARKEVEWVEEEDQTQTKDKGHITVFRHPAFSDSE